MTTFTYRACMLAVLSALFAGCTTVKTIHSNDADVVAVENEGYYLFQFLPLVTGNPNSPNKCSCKMFSNTLKVKTNMRLLSEEIARKGAKEVSDIATFTTEESIIPILFCRKTMQTSARLVW